MKISADLNPFYFKLSPAIVMLEMENADAMNNLLNRFKEAFHIRDIISLRMNALSMNPKLNKLLVIVSLRRNDIDAL